MSTGELKVIVYGLGKTVWDAIGYIRTRFHIIGCSDSDFRKTDVAERLGYPFMPPEMLSTADYDYIFIVSIYDEEISRQLIAGGIAQDKILKRNQWDSMLFYHSYGEQNPDKTFYVLSRPIHTRDGVFSFLFAFLEQLDYVESHGCIPVVDMQSFKSQYLEEDKVGVENAWDYYFQPLSEYSLTEVYESKNVILGYDDPCYKNDYEKRYDIKRMSELYRKYIRYNSKTIAAIQEERDRLIDKTRKTLGVLYRGSDMSALKLKNHPIQPTVDEMCLLIHKYMEEWGCEQIFLSTEDEEAAARFKEEFGDSLNCTSQRRFGNTGHNWLAEISFDRHNDRYLRGLEYLTTIELLSGCDCLLAGICAGSVCAHIMNNGKYEHIIMVDKGEY